MFEELHAAHLWHPLIDEQQRDCVVALAELVEGRQRLGAGACAYDAVVSAKVPAQVTFDGSEHARVVSDRE
jgi:hypothetical protein